MICRAVFVEKYVVHHGMPGEDVSDLSRAALERCLERLNAFIEGRHVISVLETRFRNNNSDDSPFWEKLVVFYEEKAKVEPITRRKA